MEIDDPPGPASAAHFKDHFSGHAELYRRFRPTYPRAVFAWLASLAPTRKLAWDAGTGNGQAAALLAEHFAHVEASDASAAQLAAATPHPGVHYRVAPAEASGLADASVDLALSAQALHWFDHVRYFAEVRRVVRPGGVVAALTYMHCEVDEALDAVLAAYIDRVRADWAPERRFVDAGYATIPFPFEVIEDTAARPPMEIVAELDLAGYLGYLATWSAAQHYLRRTGVDPRVALAADFAAAWGEPESLRRVRWPLAGHVGRVT
jgi:SAM-dependent methyltransferase